MNWDSGLGFNRWHQAKKLGLTQQALIGVASARSLQPGAQWGRWAKYMLDRGFEFYDRTATRDGGIADPLFFNVHAVPQDAASARLAAARMQANAARAVEAGLGRQAASAPPALYAYDPDIGRLAVTTPAYNTAIVAVNQRAFPYGGIDLARLFDGRQEIAGTIGGTPPASFGAIVRDLSGRRVLASQVGRGAVDRGVTPLRLTKAPAGTAARASSSAGRAFAGLVHRPAGDGRGQRADGLDPRHAPLHAGLDPDALGRHAPRDRRGLQRRRAVPEHRPRPGADHRRAARRLARDRRRHPDPARGRAPARGREPLRRLHRHAAVAAAGRRRARHASRAAVLGARSGPDARGPARARRALLAHRAQRPAHAGRVNGR